MIHTQKQVTGFSLDLDPFTALFLEPVHVGRSETIPVTSPDLLIRIFI